MSHTDSIPGLQFEDEHVYSHVKKLGNSYKWKVLVVEEYGDASTKTQADLEIAEVVAQLRELRMMTKQKMRALMKPKRCEFSPPL